MTNENSLARRMLNLPAQRLDFDKTLDRFDGDALTIELRIEAASCKFIAG